MDTEIKRALTISIMDRATTKRLIKPKKWSDDELQRLAMRGAVQAAIREGRVNDDPLRQVIRDFNTQNIEGRELGL
jgi:hypothetical protein